MDGSALLDVNVLVALFDADHVHHELAHDWFADNREAGWATSPLTENGLVRVLANPKYGAALSSVPALVERLRQFKRSGHHQFWTDTVSLDDDTLFDVQRVRGFSQVTDVYLLGLATHHVGRLVTFDRSIPLAAVRGATAGTLAVIGPADDSPAT
jgi:toxin-antitoxin system PIN domain toxin